MTNIKIIPKKDKKEEIKKETVDNSTDKENKTKDIDTGKKANKIVLPGDELIKSIDYIAGHGTYREGNKIYSKLSGILKNRDHVISVIPLAGKYVPKARDFIIGEVSYITFSNWKVDFGYPSEATLPMLGVPEYIENGVDLTKYYKRGDLIFAAISSVTKGMIIQLTMKDKKARKLYSGKVIFISSPKVPRVIGKEGTMISMIKNKTGCIINVGQNGWIWIKGDNEALATKAIKMVEQYSHKSGLTNMISDFLDKELKKVGPPEKKGEQR